MAKGTRFKKGQSGNPDGRPKGARNKTTLAVEKLLDGEAEELTRKVIEKAKDGDTTALRLCLERICPPRKDWPVQLNFPATDTPKGATQAVAAIIAAVATGDVTPAEGQALAGLVESQRRAIETQELEKRVVVLERNQGAKR